MKENTIFYSELYSVLNLLGPDYIYKIPNQLYNKIISNKSDYYLKKYSHTQLLSQQVSKDVLAFIAFLHYSYWCDTEEEKNDIKQILIQNEKKHNPQVKMQIKEDLFTPKVPIKKDYEKISNDLLPVNIENKKWYHKLIQFIKKIRRKN